MDEANPGGNLKALLEANLRSKEDNTQNIDPKTLKWAIYARKSTEDEHRQIQSIPDQIRECLEKIVKTEGLVVNPSVDIFSEEKSAKESGTRPVFAELISKIKDGQYTGLIAWHYDRLARNMKDAGEIIDLIDRGQLKGLKFATAHFENSPNGKMVLGINFVLSKSYSDHLSESVTRGNRSSTLKGRILKKQVHGYKITDLRDRLIADDENYMLIEKAFRMRLAGNGLAEIAKYLNDHRYHSYRPHRGHKLYTFDVDAVSSMLKNPVYAGYYVYGDRYVDMSDVDNDFSPMVTEDEFLQINKGSNLLSYAHSRSTRIAPSNVSNFLRRMVICDCCQHAMSTSITTKLGGKPGDKDRPIISLSFRYKCETYSCEMRGSGPRGRLIINHVLEFLESHKFTSRKNYEKYLQDVEGTVQERDKELRTLIKKSNALLTEKKREFENARKVAAEPSNALSKFYTPQYLSSLESEITDLEYEITKSKQEISTAKGFETTYEEFLELFENVDKLLRSTTGLSQSDEIIRIFFSNFTVRGSLAPPNYKQKQWSVIDHCLAEPFKTFVENGEFSNGRDKATSAEPIIEALYQLLLSYPRLKRRLDKTKVQLLSVIKPETMTSIEFLR